MFDIQATIRWVTAILKDPQAAATDYRESAAGWQQSFMQITLPVYVAASVVGLVVALITGGTFMFGSLSVGVFVFSLLWSLGWTFVVAFIFDYLAGVFDGNRGYDAAYAVVALAIIPSAAGSAIAPVPWVGWLIGLAASIYSLVLAYRFIPTFLGVPDTSRAKHFIVSIIAAIVVNLIVSVTVGSMFAPSMVLGDIEVGTRDSVSTGLFGGFERQVNFTEAAANDRYEPPADGKVSEAQMEQYVDVMLKTRSLQARLGESLEGMDDEDVSISDVFGGISGAVRLGTAEMEVVKTGGGNWAEHQWIKGQIEVARIQQDLNDTTSHNYQLFVEYQGEIESKD